MRGDLYQGRGVSEDSDGVSRLWKGGVMNHIWGDESYQQRASLGRGIWTPKRKLRKEGRERPTGPRLGMAQNILALGAQLGLAEGSCVPG